MVEMVKGVGRNNLVTMHPVAVAEEMQCYVRIKLTSAENFIPMVVKVVDVRILLLTPCLQVATDKTEVCILFSGDWL